MKAMVCTKYGPPDVLQLQEVEKPAPKDNEIQVKVRATTVNVGDCRMRSFTVPPVFWLPARISLGFTKPKNPIFGMELAGEVEAVGRDVKRFKVGDAVFGSTSAVNFGAHAEYKCLPENVVIALKPDNLTYEEAAAIPLGGLTALIFLKRAQIGRGQKVLVYGSSGSVGTYAVQIAKRFGAEVTGVCSAANFDMVKSLGADQVIDYTREDFTRTGQVYDIIFDAVGKLSFTRVKNALREKGYYIHTVMPTAALQSWWYGMTTGKQIIGGNATEHLEDLLFLKEMIEAGKLKPVIDRCYPFTHIAEAHRYVDTGRKKGSVVITMAHNDKS